MLRIPIVETKLKNNQRRYEEIVSKIKKRELKKQIDSYSEATNPYNQFEKNPAQK